MSKQEWINVWTLFCDIARREKGTAFQVILMGIMQVHNYTLGKTLVTLFITVLAAFILIFLVLLLSNLLGLVYNFFRSAYTEIIFRI